MIGNDGQHTCRYKNKHNSRKEQGIISITKKKLNLLKWFDYNSHLIFFKTTMRCNE